MGISTPVSPQPNHPIPRIAVNMITAGKTLYLAILATLAILPDILTRLLTHATPYTPQFVDFPTCVKIHPTMSPKRSTQ